MEKASLPKMIKYLTEPYYPEKLRLEDFNVLFDTMQSAISNENFRLAHQKANNKSSSLKKTKSYNVNVNTNKSNSTTQRMQTETNNSYSSKKQPVTKSKFEINTDDNNNVTIKRVEGKKPIPLNVSKRKKELLYQILTDRSSKIQPSPCEYTLKPKIHPKQFNEVPISSAINRFHYQYTT